MTPSEHPPCKWASVSAPLFADATCRQASDPSEYSRVPGRHGGGGKIAARPGAWGVPCAFGEVETEGKNFS